MDRTICFRNVTFNYAGSHQPALQDINLEIKSGEIVLITGPAGSGKTTLCSCINGLIPHYHEGDLQGDVMVGTHNTRNVRVGGLASLVGMVFQDPESQLVTNSVVDEVAFGPENLGIPREEINQRVAEALRVTRMSGYEEREPHSLSGGEQQACVIAATYAMQPEIYVMDEPLANLDPAGRAQVMDLVVKMVRQRGKTLIIVEHALEEIIPLAERIIVMERGRIVRDGSVEEVLAAGDIKGVFMRPPIVRLAEEIHIGAFPLKPEELAREIHNRYKPVQLKQRFERERNNGRREPIIRVQNVTFCYETDIDALYDVSLTIGAGEFVALMGRNGSGKTTLVSHLIGLLQPNQGKVTIAGKDTSTTPTHELARDVGFCFQNPSHQIVSFNVKDEMMFGLKAHNIDPQEYQSRMQEALEIVNMQDYLDAEIFDLGKGQKQRIALASVLTLKPKILIVDEPTTGQDPEMSIDIFEIIKKLNQNGTTVIVITHNVDLAALYAERAVVLNQGRVSFDGDIRDLLRNEDLMKANSLELPHITRLAKSLSMYGIPENTVSFMEMKNYLQEITGVHHDY